MNGVGEGVDEGALSSHFGQFGAGVVEAIEVGGDGSAVVKFKTRRGAEIALKSKGDMNGSRLTMGWHTEVAPKVEEAGKEAEAGKAEEVRDADL